MAKVQMNDEQIRSAAFARIANLDARFVGAIPWSEISAGVTVANETVLLCGRARGIFRPRQMQRGVISIKTTIPREGRLRRYEDIASDEGYFVYKFMGDDPTNPDNRALREAWEDKSPLIYFHGIAPGLYQAIWPIYITHWDGVAMSVQAVPGERIGTGGEMPESEDLRRYSVMEAKRRLHQAVFREVVLQAYEGRCALTGLPERRLLHAAHILPDRDRRGQPVVSNGIAMSVLHHTAFDLHLLGIDPDFRIHVNRGLLEIHDGPTLQAVQALDGQCLRLPGIASAHPSRDFLAERYEQFCRVA